MFDNVNGARLAAKRIQDGAGTKASVAKELVARLAGWPDWHRLEKEVGGDAPRARPHAGLDAYAAAHGVALDAKTLSDLASPIERSGVHGTTRIALTEGAMRMLTALHCGCDVRIWNSRDGDRYCDIRTHTVAPYTSNRSSWRNFQQPDAELITGKHTETRRVEAWLEEDEAQDYLDDSPPRQRGRYDHDKAVRLDNWTGEDRREEYRDGLMLVRAGLAIHRMSDLRITEAGRAMAQAAVGDGRVIDKGEATPVRGTPDRNYVVGEPRGFALMDETVCEQAVSLSPGQKGVYIAGSSQVGPCGVEVRPEVVKTMAAFLADVGKVDRPTTVRFGDVQVTLEADGPAATLAFGDDDNQVRARMPKALARIARTYMMELARGGRQKAVLDPVDVTWKATFASRPESMAA
jgi:hypothetical protein